MIASLYFVLVTLYAVIIPPWESPDEPAHYLYIVQLADRWRPPSDPQVRQRASFSKDYEFISSNYEWYQPALGYLPGAIVYKLLNILAPSTLPTDIPPLNPQFGAHKNLFLHGNIQVLNVWNGLEGLLILRIASALLGLVPLFAAYRIGCLLEDATLGWVAAGWVALLPQFTFISASVRSDTMANAVGALVCMASVEMLIRKTAPLKVVGLGILIGLGILTKYTFLYLIPFGWLAIVLSEPGSLRRYVWNLSLLMIPLIFIVGGYFLAFREAREAFIYTYHYALKIRPEALSWEYLRRIPRPLFMDLFFGRLGWANVVTSTFFIRLSFWLWCGLAIITCIKMISINKEQKKIVLALGMLGCALFLACAGAFRYNLSVFQPQGRFLFPVLVAWAVLGLWGAVRSLKTQGRVLAVWLLIGYMGVFNITSLIKLAVTYY